MIISAGWFRAEDGTPPPNALDHFQDMALGQPPDSTDLENGSSASRCQKVNFSSNAGVVDRDVTPSARPPQQSPQPSPLLGRRRRAAWHRWRSDRRDHGPPPPWLLVDHGGAGGRDTISEADLRQVEFACSLSLRSIRRSLLSVARTARNAAPGTGDGLDQPAFAPAGLGTQAEV